MIDINLMGPIHVIETFVPPMVAAGRGGHLVNVSSAAGLVALPWHAAYSASKYGLRGLSEVLRFDLARHRIGVSVVVPGAVKTPLVQHRRDRRRGPRRPAASHQWVERFAGHAVSPEQAADKILAGVAKNRYLIYTSPDIRALYAFKRLAWWPYSVAMRQVNVIFTRALRPSPPTLVRHDAARDALRAGGPAGRARIGRERERAAATMTSRSVLGASSLRILVRV